MGDGSSDSDSDNNAGGSALLSWSEPTINEDGSSLTDLSGYKVYYGTSSGSYSGIYSTSVDVGNVTSSLIAGLTPGTTYYFAVKAYDTSGNKSVYSEEVSIDTL